MSRRGLLRGFDRAIAKETRYARGRQRRVARYPASGHELDLSPSMPTFLRNLAFERIEEYFRGRFKIFNGGDDSEVAWRGPAWRVQSAVIEMRVRRRKRKPLEVTKT